MKDNGLECKYMKWGLIASGEEDTEHELFCKKDGRICTGCKELEKQREVKNMVKHCNNCKNDITFIDQEPCKSCKNYSKWEPKENYSKLEPKKDENELEKVKKENMEMHDYIRQLKFDIHKLKKSNEDLTNENKTLKERITWVCEQQKALEEINNLLNEDNAKLCKKLENNNKKLNDNLTNEFLYKKLDELLNLVRDIYEHLENQNEINQAQHELNEILKIMIEVK